jgi:uncharacterized protein with PhoU and TrkA domain
MEQSVRTNETTIEVSRDRTTGRFVIAIVRGADWVFIRDEPILADAIQIAQRGANSFGLRVTEKIF